MPWDQRALGNSHSAQGKGKRGGRGDLQAGLQAGPRAVGPQVCSGGGSGAQSENCLRCQVPLNTVLAGKIIAFNYAKTKVEPVEVRHCSLDGEVSGFI